MTARIAVVGAGISGLTAAYRLRRARPDAVLHVYESGARIGGVLDTADVGGQAVDVGAEAFLVRRPEARDLIAALGLAEEIVAPGPARPSVFSGARLHDLPSPALMGIPADPEVMSGLADEADLVRMRGEADREWHWTPGSDPSVGELVGDRFGPSVVARAVDPLLGGVYSSRAADIGVRESLPALAQRLDAGAPSLRAAVGALLDVPRTDGPVFGALRGGYRTLVDALREAIGTEVRTCSAVTDLHREPGGWALLGRNRREGNGEVDDDHLRYDAVVLAVPASEAGHILRRVARESADVLLAVRRSSPVLVSMAFSPGTALPERSGVLVASGEDLHAKAFTFSSVKWPHLAGPGRTVSVRASFGRFGAPVPDDCTEPGVADRLLGEALADLDRVCEAAGVAPVSGALVDSSVHRWTGGLPVYAPGHLAAMETARLACPPGIALAGSAYAGVGVPACIAQAGRAAGEVLASLE